MPRRVPLRYEDQPRPRRSRAPIWYPDPRKAARMAEYEQDAKTESCDESEAVEA